MGVLFCKGEVLQLFKDVKVVVVDKIGMFIEGCLVLIDFDVVSGFECCEVLVKVVVVELCLEYLIVCVIVVLVEEEGSVLSGMNGFELVIGMGVYVIVDGMCVDVGVDCYMCEIGVDISGFVIIVEWLGQEGKLLFYVVIDG